MAVHANPPALISMSQIVAEFGGTAPHSLSEYYRNGIYVVGTGAPSVPISPAAIRLSNFYGASLYTPGEQSFSSVGNFSFTVPSGATNLMVMVVGGGGGGGGCQGSGDSHAGGGGGSGGNTGLVHLDVSPGQVFYGKVGAGGQNAGVYFNQWIFHNNNTFTGTQGGTSTFGTLNATGGFGGSSSDGDSCTGASGAGGSPNGVAGGAIDCNRNSYAATQGGYYGYGGGYGRGGNSHGYGGSGIYNGTYGGNGYVYLYW